MNFRGKIVDEFQHVYDKMKAHNKIMIANDNAVLEELQEELDNRLRD